MFALLASADMPSRNNECPKTKKQVLDATRLDGKDHLVNKNATDTQRRCAACGRVGPLGFVSAMNRAHRPKA